MTNKIGSNVLKHSYKSLPTGDPQKDLFYQKYTFIHGFFPDKFKGLKWSNLFRTFIRVREKDVLKLKPDEFVALNKATRYLWDESKSELIKHKKLFMRLDLKDPQGVRELIYGYKRIMM